MHPSESWAWLTCDSKVQPDVGNTHAASDGAIEGAASIMRLLAKVSEEGCNTRVDHCRSHQSDVQCMHPLCHLSPATITAFSRSLCSLWHFIWTRRARLLSGNKVYGPAALMPSCPVGYLKRTTSTHLNMSAWTVSPLKRLCSVLSSAPEGL